MKYQKFTYKIFPIMISDRRRFCQNCGGYILPKIGVAGKRWCVICNSKLPEN